MTSDRLLTEDAAHRAVPSIAVGMTGARRHAHGADIFEALRHLTGATADMVLTMRRPCACAIAVLDDTASPGSTAGLGSDDIGSFHHRRDGTMQRHRLRPLPDRPIPARIPFDEAALIEGARMEAMGARLPAGATGMPIVRRAVALSVALLKRDEPDTFWLLAEIACTRLLPAGAAIEIALAGHAGPFRRVAMAADGAPFGRLLLARERPC